MAAADLSGDVVRAVGSLTDDCEWRRAPETEGPFFFLEWVALVRLCLTSVVIPRPRFKSMVARRPFSTAHHSRPHKIARSTTPNPTPPEPARAAPDCCANTPPNATPSFLDRYSDRTRRPPPRIDARPASSRSEPQVAPATGRIRSQELDRLTPNRLLDRFDDHRNVVIALPRQQQHVCVFGHDHVRPKIETPPAPRAIQRFNEPQSRPILAQERQSLVTGERQLVCVPRIIESH